MNLQQVAVRLGGLPVQLLCVSNGCVVFQRLGNFNDIWDNRAKGSVWCDFNNDHFTFSAEGNPSETYDYNTLHEYKNIPLMLKWLQQQNLQSPNLGAPF